MTAYYNEIDPYAAQWLRNLIAAGHIAPGVVDERSIEDVKPEELKGFTQCHFFAGAGVWSLALRRAGWPDSRPIWTASCPCQPFSAAGVGAAFEDARHLYPSLGWLVSECKPPIIIGEQVASKAVDAWVDLVHADMEAMDYAFGAVPFPSAGVGSPQIRDRCYWVAYANDQCEEPPTIGTGAADAGGRSSAPYRMGHTDNPGLERHAGPGSPEKWERTNRPVATAGPCSGLANPDSDGRHQGGQGVASTGLHGPERDGAAFALAALDTDSGCDGPWRGGPVNGLWADSDWLFCRDGKWRPVEPGTSPLAHGAPSRVGRLRAYGNAVNAEAARVFIECVMDL